MIITKKAKKTYAYINRVKKKLIKEAKKGPYNCNIGKLEWHKASEMLEGDIYYNVIMADFSYFIYTLKAAMKGNYNEND